MGLVYFELDKAMEHPREPIAKQVWNGTEFVSVFQYRVKGQLTLDQKSWLSAQFGPRGSRWDYSTAGDFFVIDSQAYTWFKLKWNV